MTEEVKERLFNAMLRLEKLGEHGTYDGHDYIEQSNGAYEMLAIMGLGTEYLNWAIGK